MDARQETLDLTNATTAQLVVAAQGADRQAQEELVYRFEASIYGLAMRRLGNHAEAQELCQDVIMQALAKLHQLRRARGIWKLAAVDHFADGDQSAYSPWTAAGQLA